MGDHFDISGVFETTEFEIAKSACILFTLFFFKIDITLVIISLYSQLIKDFSFFRIYSCIMHSSVFSSRGGAAGEGGGGVGGGQGTSLTPLPSFQGIASPKDFGHLDTTIQPQELQSDIIQVYF